MCQNGNWSLPSPSQKVTKLLIVLGNATKLLEFATKSLARIPLQDLDK